MRITFNNWLVASRPVTLTASIVPILVGTAMASLSHRIDWTLFLATLFGGICIQIGTNLADEYTDHRRAGSEKFPAPHKVIQRGLLTEGAVIVGACSFFILASVLGLYIISLIGWPILIIGIMSISAGYLYSSGPFPLGNWGLGELTVFLFMGPWIVLSSFYVQTQELTWPSSLASLPVAFLVTAILQANNIRDIDEDRSNHKHTLTTLLGLTTGRQFYVILILCSYISIVAIVLSGNLPWLALVSLLSSLQALSLIRFFGHSRERQDFNLVLVKTAKLHMLTGVLLSVGIYCNTLF